MPLCRSSLRFRRPGVVSQRRTSACTCAHDFVRGAFLVPMHTVRLPTRRFCGPYRLNHGAVTNRDALHEPMQARCLPYSPYSAAASARDRSKHAGQGRGDHHCTGDLPLPRSRGTLTKPWSIERAPSNVLENTRSTTVIHKVTMLHRNSAKRPAAAGGGKISLVNGPDSAGSPVLSRKLTDWRTRTRP